MTTMKTKLYTVLTAALLSTTVLSTAQGASADAGASARNILSLLASLGEAHTAMAAVVHSKIVATDEDFLDKLASMSPRTTDLDLSHVTMDSTKTELLLASLGHRASKPLVADESLDLDEAMRYSLDTIINYPPLSLRKIKFGNINVADALSILDAVTHMASVKNITFATPLVIDGASLKDISSFRPDLMFGFTYEGRLPPLLEQVRKRPFPQLTTLDLVGNYIDVDGVRDLAGALVSVPGLTTLYLQNNSIGVDGARALAAALHHVPQLTQLYLLGNDIGDAGARALARALVSVPELTTLNLGSNRIGVDGARALAGALVSVPELTTLYLGLNSIGDDGAVALARALVSVPELTTLYLAENRIGDDGAVALAEALRNLLQLKTLGLGSNSIGADGAVALAGALVSVPQLKSLDLGSNRIGHAGAVALAGALVSVPQLTTLRLRGNPISAAGDAALHAAAARQPGLQLRT